MLVMLFAMGVLRLPSGSVWAPAETVQTDSASATAVARLEAAENCRWSESAAGPIQGDPLPAGRQLQLESGTARITYTTGASVELIGPAQYVVAGAGQGTLTSGRLTALVPPAAVGFTVRTPSAIVVDRGTQFGLAVDDPGTVEVHVFEGRVEAELLASGGPTGSKIALSGGRAAKLNSLAASIESFNARRSQFASDHPEPSAEQTAQTQSGPSPIDLWNRRRDETSRDGYLLAYYDFQNGRTAPMRLVNVASSTTKRLDGIFVATPLSPLHPEWTAGRWTGKAALLFESQHEHHIQVDYDDLLLANDSLSIFASVDNAAAGPILTNRDSRQDRPNYQFGLFDPPDDSAPDQLRFGIGGDEPLEKRFVYSDPIPSADQPWRHVAVTFANRNVTFYVNGRAAGRRRLAHKPPVASPQLWIGRGYKPTDPSANAKIAFDGRMDELAIFRRVLSPKEMRELAGAGGANGPQL